MQKLTDRMLKFEVNITPSWYMEDTAIGCTRLAKAMIAVIKKSAVYEVHATAKDLLLSVYLYKDDANPESFLRRCNELKDMIENIERE
jgi:hypothetical protein